MSRDLAVAGYRHVYLEGMEEASIFVHVAIGDISGKVSATCTAAPKPHPALSLARGLVLGLLSTCGMGAT